MGTRFPPRKLTLDELMSVLVTEHLTMRESLERAREAAARKDFAGVGKILRSLDPLFRQHIADEEAQILGLLVRELGRKGAEQEITVFRQHRPIYNLMVKIGELALVSSAELEAREEELIELFSQHALAEETSVFPKAESLGKQPHSAPRPTRR